MSEYAPNEHGEHLWVDLSAGFWDTEQPMDGWVDLTELEARAEAAERALEDQDSHWANIYAQACTRYEKAEATLAAVRERCKRAMKHNVGSERKLGRELLAIIDRKGES